MIVEDDALLNKMLTHDLASGGYEVTAVLNARGKKCLESADPDLVLLDVNLPDGNGYMICAA